MDPYQSRGNSQLDRQLAMSILMNSGTSASEAVKLARLQQQQQEEHHQGLQQSHQGAQPQSLLHQTGLGPSAYTPEMLRLHRDILAARSGSLPSLAPGSETLPFLRGTALNTSQHSPLSSLLSQQVYAHQSALAFPSSMGAGYRRNSPPLSPSTKPEPDPMGPRKALHSVKRTAAYHRDSLGGSSHSSESSNKRARMAAYPPSPHQMPLRMAVPPQQQMRRGSKATLRDDFWGKVGKNNSHIHLVNIVLGRLLYDQVKKAKGGNKVLSNDLIQQILEHKLYGKYAVKDFFASSNKASETVRNTWTRLNFASDDIRKGLSRYKEQTWQAIERCEFDGVCEKDQKEMDDALKSFVSTGRFVAALDVALKGIITEPFMGVLMQLRIEWNGLCLSCSPEDHDSVVGAFLRKYGLNGK